MKIIPNNKKELKTIIKNNIQKNGVNCSLNHIDVSQITDFSETFQHVFFNGDISNWDVSNVKDMHDIFHNSQLQKEDKLPYWNLPTQEERINTYLKYHTKKEKKQIEDFLDLSSMHKVNKKMKFNKI